MIRRISTLTQTIGSGKGYELFARRISSRHFLAARLSMPPMLHPHIAESADSLGMAPSISVKIDRGNRSNAFQLSLWFRHLERSRNLQLKQLTLATLLKSNHALSELVQALWSVYRSNNLQLSQSLFNLINTITERRTQNSVVNLEGLAEVHHSQRNVLHRIRTIDTALIRRLTEFRQGETSQQTIVRISSAPLIREKSMTALVTATHAMNPILERIYEGIESSAFLYNESSYKSSKTLYRLTNSLWKIYQGQNLEISRSFIRLITRVTDESITHRRSQNSRNIFRTTHSLKNLVGGLKQAFSGNNLELRSSLVSLFSDIHKAGQSRHLMTTRSMNHHLHLMLFNPILPHYERQNLVYHKSTANATSTQQSVAGDIAKAVEKRLDTLEAASSSHHYPKLDEGTLRRIVRDIDKEKQLDWRIEKLQRGIF